MKRITLAAILLVIACGLGIAQSNTGRLTGTVKGPDGVIAGATVVLRDNQTAKEKTTITTGEGTFEFAQLDFGSYTITVTAQGFKTYTGTDLKIDVGQQYDLNVPLEVGQVTETVTVTAGAEVLNAVDAQISNTVSPTQIKELPLNGRNPINLIQLQAGTANNGTGDTVINGQRSSFTNITRDGINVQDNFIRANATDFLPERPSVDNTGEFTIVTQNASADQGNGASQVQLVTPRGQNAFHGSLFEYNRNSAVAANDFFNNASNVKRPFLNRNQFGGTISGPAIKDKLFFFGYYEGLRLATGATESRTILTPSARTGIFTFKDPTGVTRTVNVLTLAGLSGIDPLAQSRFLANIPAVGNRTDIGDNLNTTGFGFTQSAATQRDAWTTRVDYDINSKNTINGVFTYSKENNLRPDVDASQALGGGFASLPVTVQPSKNKFLALAYRRTAATFTNEVRGGFFKSAPIFQNVGPVPAFFVNLPLVSSPEVNFQEQGRFANTYNIQDNAEYDRGQHSIRFGGDLTWYRINPFGPGAFGSSTIPTFTVGTGVNTVALTASQFPTGISATQLNNANALLALLGGIVSSGSQSFNATTQTSGFVPGSVPNRHLAYENLGLYGQDQWRVRSNFTINYGLRDEIFTAVREPNGLALEPVIPAGETVQQAVLDPNGTFNFVGTNAGGDHKFFKNQPFNFGPVISIAYSPESSMRLFNRLLGETGRTVIRAGYRISYVNDEFVRAADNALGNNVGLSATANALQTIGGTPTPFLNTTLSNLSSIGSITAPTFQVPRTFAQNNALAGNFGAVFAIDPNLKAPRIHEFNFGIQRELGANSAIEIRYVGSFSHNEVRALDFNQVNVNANGFVADFNRARQNLVLSTALHATNTAIPVSPVFNPAVPGSQALTVFPTLGRGGLLGALATSTTPFVAANSTVASDLINGIPADLAILFVQNGLAGSVPFLPNPNTGVADVLGNSAKFSYNSLQAEYRRRLSRGLYLQANYTFQKALTNAGGVSQTRTDTALDNNQLNLEYARADYDQTHVFNLNTIYELPFGAGRRFLNNNGLEDRIIGGWQLTSIIRWSSGAPITITDPRGTLNRVGRSGSQTPNTTLTPSELSNLFGVFETPNGVFFINPSAGITNPATGRAAEGFGTTPFSGQVFFNAAPGQTGNLSRAFFNGPSFFNWDASLLKDIRVKENIRLQFRAEAFNLLNKPNFFLSNRPGTFNINSTNFGKITSDFGPRVTQFALRLEF